MTNSARISDIAFPDVAKGSKIRRKATLTNESGQVVNVTGINSSMGYFSSAFARKVQPNFPASSTIYFRENHVLQNVNGEFATTDLGFGKAGTTDADGKFTFKPAMLSLSLTAPTAGTKYKLSESFNVTWTSSNITLVNIILESESGGYKIFEDVDASLGTLAVSILASDGFKINETVYIYIENTHQTLEDSVDVVVASGTVKTQMQCVNFDFTSRDAVVVDNDRVAIMGYMDNFATGTKTIDGVEIDTGLKSAMNLTVLYNTSTKSVEWAVGDLLTITTYNYHSNSKPLHKAGDYVYAMHFSAKIIRKIKITDGTYTDISFPAGAVSYQPNLSTMGGDNNYIYVFWGGAAYGNQDARGFRLNLADDTVGSVVTIAFPTQRTEGIPLSVHTDGTYVYWCGQDLSSSLWRSCIIRSDMAIANQTVYKRHYLYDGLDGAVITYHGGSCINQGKIITIQHDVNASWGFVIRWMADEDDNKITTTFGGNLHSADNKIWNIGGLNLERINNDITRNFSKNYSTEDILSLAKVVCLNGKCLLIVTTQGNLDGEHSDNTRKCPAIVGFDIDNGDIL